MTTISERHQSDHLFLLVGTNPLPVYVAAQLLVRREGTVHLFASSATVGVAEQIRSKIEAHCIIIELMEVSDAYSIGLELITYLDGLPHRSNDHIGFNYTGGTKPMAVHSHETLQAWCGDKNLRYAYSYLDPRYLAFRFANGVSVAVQASDCPLTLEQLVELHGWQISEAKGEPVLPELSEELAQVLSRDDRLSEWRQWCNWNIRTWRGRNQWRKADWPAFIAAGNGASLVQWAEEARQHAQDIQQLLQWVSSARLKEKKRDLADVPVPALLPSASSATTATTLAEWRAGVAPETGWADNNAGFKKVADYLDAGWLESYVLSCLIKNREACQLGRPWMNVFVARVDSDGHHNEFEFDVAVTRGYQLFAIACSTDTSRGLNKHKLLEAYTRARQMGGDEARVALVGGYADTNDLLREVNEEWLAPQDMIRVFGPQDWMMLEDRLAAWFNWQPL